MPENNNNKSEQKISRRKLLKFGGATAALAIAGGVQSGITSASKVVKGKKMAMVIDLRKCYGCNACAVSCKSENGVVLGNFRSWVGQVNKGKYPDVTRHFLPRLCNHCEKPACVKVCPTGASNKKDNGVVSIDKNVCIGCRYCMSACPYGVRSFVWKKRDGNELAYPSRQVGIADKCDLCFHRLEKGVVPACVNTCPASARILGDLNDPESEVSKIIASNPVQTLLPELGTGPNVYYIGLDQKAAEVSIASGVRMSPLEIE